MYRRHALNGGTCLKCHQTWSAWLTLVCVSFLKRTFESRSSVAMLLPLYIWVRVNRRSSYPICSTSVMVKVKMNGSSEPLWWKSPILSLFIDIHRKFIENHRKIDFRWILWKFQNWSRISNPTLRSRVTESPPLGGVGGIVGGRRGPTIRCAVRVRMWSSYMGGGSSSIPCLFICARGFDCRDFRPSTESFIQIPYF